MRYSPHDISSYRLLGTKADEVTVIMGFEEISIPVWNLFWLSVPSLDKVPDAGERWYRVYRPVPGLLTAIYRDISRDTQLSNKLRDHPLLFLDWFERQDIKRFGTSVVCIGPNWGQTVTERAQEAADRMILAAPPVIVTDNVIKVDFRRAA